MHIQEASVGSFIQNKEYKFLLVKRSGSDDFYPGFWELPGGGVDYGEDPQTALVREIKEECGLDIIVKLPLTVNTYQMTRETDEIQRVEITYVCQLQMENQDILLSFEHSEYTWISKNEVKDFALSEYMRKVIEDCLDNPLLFM